MQIEITTDAERGYGVAVAGSNWRFYDTEREAAAAAFRLMTDDVLSDGHMNWIVVDTGLSMDHDMSDVGPGAVLLVDGTYGVAVISYMSANVDVDEALSLAEDAALERGYEGWAAQEIIDTPPESQFEDAGYRRNPPTDKVGGYRSNAQSESEKRQRERRRNTRPKRRGDSPTWLSRSQEPGRKSERVKVSSAIRLRRNPTRGGWQTKEETVAEFRREYLPHIPRHDRVAKAEAWHNFTDELQWEGRISMSQYESWGNPF